MDNVDQLKIIKHYQMHLKRILHSDVDINSAAKIWIERYAQLWREKHQPATKLYSDLFQQ